MGFICTAPMRFVVGLICVLVIAANFMVTPAVAAETSPYVQVSVALLTGILGFVGSWIGAQVALANFKKQKAFDKQLDWYERAVAAIHSMAEKIIIAVNSEDNDEPVKKRNADWVEVQLAHRVIDRVAQEAPLYATDSAITEITEVQKRVQKVADNTEAFDPPHFPKDADRYELLKEIYELGEYLEASSPPLLREGRIHLGIGSSGCRRQTAGFFRRSSFQAASADEKHATKKTSVPPRSK